MHGAVNAEVEGRQIVLRVAWRDIVPPKIAANNCRETNNDDICLLPSSISFWQKEKDCNRRRGCQGVDLIMGFTVPTLHRR